MVFGAGKYFRIFGNVEWGNVFRNFGNIEKFSHLALNHPRKFYVRGIWILT